MSYITLTRPTKPIRVKELITLLEKASGNHRVVIDGLATDIDIVEIGLGCVNDERVFVIEVRSNGTWSESNG